MVFSYVNSIIMTILSRVLSAKWHKLIWQQRGPTLPPYAHVTQIGDPVLRNVASPVPLEEIKSREVDLVVTQMIDVLQRYDCVGLAAPQIGISLRIMIMQFKESLTKKFSDPVYKARQMETLPLTVVINPELKVTNYNKKTFSEGCMSVRGYSADVDRFEEVELKGFDRDGSEILLNLKGWNARIAQHEMDHLNGKLYVDHMDTSTFKCTCWEDVNQKAGRVEIPFYE